jgi:hypothetical protein
MLVAMRLASSRVNLFGVFDEEAFLLLIVGPGRRRSDFMAFTKF